MLFDTQQRIALNTQQKVWIHNKKLHAGTSGTTESLAGSHYIDQFTTYYTRSLVVGMRTRAYILRFDFIVERMFCCFCRNSLEARFGYCPTCGKKKNDTGPGGASTSSATHCDFLSRRPDNARDNSASGPNKKGASIPGPPSLAYFMKEKEVERRFHFESKNKKARTSQSKAKDYVLINVGLMEYERGEGFERAMH